MKLILSEIGSNLAELSGLLAGNVGGVVQVLVNEILVLDVDQRSEVDNKGGEEKQAPLGSDLDEEVADEGGEEGLKTLVLGSS